MLRHPSGEQWPFGREPREAFGELCLDVSRLLAWLTPLFLLLVHGGSWSAPHRNFFSKHRYHYHSSGDTLTDARRLGVLTVALGLCWTALQVVRKPAPTAGGTALLAACVLALPFLPAGAGGANFRDEACLLAAASVCYLIGHALGARDYAA